MKLVPQSLLVSYQRPQICMETLITDFLYFPYLSLGEFGLLFFGLFVGVSVVCLELSQSQPFSVQQGEGGGANLILFPNRGLVLKSWSKSLTRGTVWNSPGHKLKQCTNLIIHGEDYTSLAASLPVHKIGGAYSRVGR